MENKIKPNKSLIKHSTKLINLHFKNQIKRSVQSKPNNSSNLLIKTNKYTSKPIQTNKIINQISSFAAKIFSRTLRRRARHPRPQHDPKDSCWQRGVGDTIAKLDIQLGGK